MENINYKKWIDKLEINDYIKLKLIIFVMNRLTTYKKLYEIHNVFGKEKLKDFAIMCILYKLNSKECKKLIKMWLTNK